MIGAYDGNSWVWLADTLDPRELDGYRAIVWKEEPEGKKPKWWWAALDGNGTGSYGWNYDVDVSRVAAEQSTRTVAPSLIRGFLR